MTFRAASFIVALAIVLACQNAHAQRRCTVEGTPELLEQIVVSPRGVAPIEIDLSNLRIVVTPVTAATTPVHVETVLRFDGVSASVPYGLAREVTLGGVATVTPATSITRVRGAHGALALDASLGYGVTVLRAPVACDAVVVGSAASRAPSPSRHADQRGDGTYWIPRHALLTFRAHPSERAAGLLVHADLRVLLSMTRTEHRAGWSRLTWDGEHGARVDGWVRDVALEPMPIGSVSGFPSGIGHMGCLPGGRIGGTHVYNGPAIVAAGATVFAERGRGEWATFASEQNVEVTHIDGDAWVQIRRIDGVSEHQRCGVLERAFVQVESVRLPDGEWGM